MNFCRTTLVLAAVLAACTNGVSVDSLGRPTKTLEPVAIGDDIPIARFHALGYVDPWMPSALGFPSDTSPLPFSQFTAFASDRRGIVLQHMERQVTFTEREQYLYRSDCEITATYNARPNAILVGGETDAGERIVELWIVEPPAGSLTLENVISDAPFGTPAPPPEPTSVATVGDTYVQLNHQTLPPLVHCTQLLRDTAPDSIRAIAADPELRVLTLLTEDGHLTQHRLDTRDLESTLELSPVDHPVLALVGVPSIMGHEDHGLVMIFSTDEPFTTLADGTPVKTPRFLLIDRDNDGRVDEFGTWAALDVRDAGFWDQSKVIWSN